MENIGFFSEGTGFLEAINTNKITIVDLILVIHVSIRYFTYNVIITIVILYDRHTLHYITMY